MLLFLFMRMKELLKKLSEANGVSGSEKDVRNVILKELKGHCDKVRVDRLGNIIATKKGKKPSVMLAAHTDEIGLVVKFIDEKGYLRFAKVGGIDDRTLVSRRVVIHSKKEVTGVIGARPPHLLEPDEEKKITKHKDMFIDIGAKNKKEAEKLVMLGDFATFDVKMMELEGGLVTGKAFDDRTGVAVLIRTLQKLKSENEINVVFTVQEEVGLKGARTSAYAVDPDIAIAVDVGFAGDNPGVKEEEAPAKLGEGPALVFLEASGRGAISNRGLVKWMQDTAKGSKLPLQFVISEAGMTDAAILNLNKEGTRTLSFSIPSRYMHSPVEVVNIKDLESSVELLVNALKNVPA